MHNKLHACESWLTEPSLLRMSTSSSPRTSRASTLVTPVWRHRSSRMALLSQARHPNQRRSQIRQTCQSRSRPQQQNGHLVEESLTTLRAARFSGKQSSPTPTLKRRVRTKATRLTETRRPNQPKAILQPCHRAWASPSRLSGSLQTAYHSTVPGASATRGMPIAKSRLRGMARSLNPVSESAWSRCSIAWALPLRVHR